MVRLVMGLLGISVSLTLFVLVHCSQLQESYCRYGLEEIERTLNCSGDVREFVVNCLVRNRTYAQSLSISVFREDDNDSMRYDFQCVGGATLIPTLSEFVSNEANSACASCNFAMEDPCVGRCDDLCGSCTNNTSNCLTCRYLERIEEHEHNGTCLDSSSCGMHGFTSKEEGCVCDGYLQLYELHEGDPEYLLPNEEFTYRCINVSDCVAPNVRRDEERICEVCGVEKCVRCDNECTECVREYEVVEEEGHIECVTEAEAERRELEEKLRELTEELIHEQEEEEEEREDTELHLRILLPIFCTLTIVMCVGMSVFTHYWYPYIDQDGKKRSKTKPSEEEQPTVWRPRPTIRFR